jgi:putative RecB family exonuclease
MEQGIAGVVTDTEEGADESAHTAGKTDELARSLSPSRAGDFMNCPLLYRFRVIDRLPEAPSAAATRGTVVHAVLESLFDLPSEERSLGSAQELVPAAWQRVLDEDEQLQELFAEDADGLKAQEWLHGTEQLLTTYFTLEDPMRLEPAHREVKVEVELDSGLTLRGYIDRLDVAPDGAMRVVDYKTGRAPRIDFEQKALFQMRFYALALWRMHGVVPRLLQLMYLTDGQVMRYEPDEADLLAMERKLVALSDAIERVTASGDWRPRPSKLCDWCAHRSRCPAWNDDVVATPAIQPTLADSEPSVGSRLG